MSTPTKEKKLIGSAGDARNPLHRLVERFNEARARRGARGATFEYDGEQLAYFLAPYNVTWANERCVELAIAEELLARESGSVLEIGNVWSHYAEHDHAVVDKYEVAPGVENIDVVDIDPSLKFDLVFSLSTMEHVGWDEEPREPEKLRSALDRLRQLISPGGSAVITFPLGWNHWLDEQIFSTGLEFDRLDWYERTGRFCSWRLSDRDALFGREYGTPYINANGLVVAVLKADAGGDSGHQES
jgi:SAM-dependent methyltransferase